MYTHACNVYSILSSLVYLLPCTLYMVGDKLYSPNLELAAIYLHAVEPLIKNNLSTKDTCLRASYLLVLGDIPKLTLAKILMINYSTG